MLSSMSKRGVLLMTGIATLTLTYWYVSDSPYDAHIVYAGSPMINAESEIRSDSPSSASSGDISGCKFPDFDPFNPEAMKYYKSFPTTSCPNGMPTITWYNGEFVKVNKTKKQEKFGDQIIQCWYRYVNYQFRVDYVNGPWKGPFTDMIKVDDKPEFVEVKCENENKKQVSRMHHYIVRKEERKSLPKPNHNNFDSERMNVLLLGVDSLASHLFKRAMPKTRTFMLDVMGSVEMKKYNKIGDNTFPNLLAISAGIYSRDLQNWTQMEGFDRLPFLWKKYRANGYKIQYMSDRVDFDEFQTLPTDSYNLPMLRALMKDKIAFNNNCFEDQIEVKLWLDLILEFARESIFTTGRFFTVGMIKRPTHDFPNEASAVDEHYFNFFKEMHETGLLNNTFVAFFGDHGPRLNDYRRTFYGSIEERAANMVIYLPFWFRQKYPSAFENLKSNAEGALTTNFDIHETALNLLSFPKVLPEHQSKFYSATGMKRGMSLFSKIPIQRTCADAAITPHVCMCNGGVQVKQPELKTEVGNQVVEDINDLLAPKSTLCVTLKLKSVESMVILNGQIGKNAMYRIMLTTAPGDANFEATVQYSKRFLFFTSIQSVGGFSRINAYRGQSDCVDEDKELRKYCYCKSVLEKLTRSPGS